ncbi:MAG: hypothetical protein KIT68_09650, partial [Phycisphaeraceae bacterium]|nr:hypothetical protein [Phycisphaeraceae bacterium]
MTVGGGGIGSRALNGRGRPGGGGTGVRGGLARRWATGARCALACVALGVAAAPVPALAQSQITPGAPSIPLTPTAQASGAQITYQYGIEFVTIPGSTLNAQPWPGTGNLSEQTGGRGAVPY